MRYLGVGEIKLNKLLMNPNFPRQKPILERWSKVEVDRWLNVPFEGQVPREEEKGWSEFFNG